MVSIWWRNPYYALGLNICNSVLFCSIFPLCVIIIHFVYIPVPFSKSLVPFLCNRVDSKGITFESYESVGEFTLANKIFSHFTSFQITIFII